MKSKVTLNVVANDDSPWFQNVDFDVLKVSEELKDHVFSFVADNAQHELLGLDKTYEVNVSLGTDDEVHELNKKFRDMDKPTNVLSFANIDDEEFFDILDNEDEIELGNIIVAYETMEKEAGLKNITLYAHYCHLLTHGFLHLLGYDHIEDEDAKIMEALEVDILREFSIDNPYQDEEEN